LGGDDARRKTDVVREVGSNSEAGRRVTQVTDDVADLNSGKITPQQLGERWAARTWLPIHPKVTSVHDVAALEVDDAFGPDGSWWEVKALVARGVISRADYSAINKTYEQIKSKAAMGRVSPTVAIKKLEVGHRQPTEIELSAKTDFELLHKNWKTQITKLLEGWDTVKGQQIVDLKDQIQNAVNNGSVQQVASIMAQDTGEDLILQHMTTMLEDSIVAAKQEAEAQGVQIPTIDTTDAVRSLQRQSSGIGQIMARSISNTAATQALTRYGVEDLSGSDVAEAVGEHLEALSSSYAEDMLGGALTQAQNQGRVLVFQQASADYYSSELLDSSTCVNCETVDGTDYASLTDAQADYPQGGYAECLGGPRCRGTLVAVYTEADSSADDS
jgi:hypothetical protein